MDELWEGALKRLRETLGKQNFETWIRPIRVRESDDGEIVLEVPNKFFRDWLVEHFYTAIQETLAELSHRSVRLSVAVNNQLQARGGTEKRVERERPKASRVNNLIPR
ncbi:MAG: DnaA N-terminal domain-containing protein, partial [Candidatus Binatota bacterium]